MDSNVNSLADTQRAIIEAAERRGYERARKETPAPGITCDSLTANCAFRYALGRQTYVVGHIAQWLIANRAALDPSTRKQIAREIGEARVHNGLGDICDARDWARVEDAMLDMLRRALPRRCSQRRLEGAAG